MKILLVQPPFSRFKQHRHSAEFQQYLGLGYLASVLSQKGYSVYYYNCDDSRNEKYPSGFDSRILRGTQLKYISEIRKGVHPVWGEFKNFLLSIKPEIIGFSVKSPLFHSALKLSEICKETLPDCKIIWGNTHPSVLPEDVLSYPWIDFVVRGEGEITLPEVVKSLSENKNLSKIEIHGLSKKLNGKIVHDPERQFINDLDSIPFPSKYLAKNARGKMPVITSRGCNKMCKFCADAGIWKRTVRFRSLENITNEIEEIINRYRIREIGFCDSTFNLYPERVISLCEMFNRKKLKFLWDCLLRIDNIDDKLIQAMSSSGCIQIAVGIETGSNNLLNEIDKQLTLVEIKKNFSIIKKHNIIATALFIVGLPTENTEDIKKSTQLLKELLPSRVFISNFTPLPGSQYFDELYKNRNNLKSFPWEKLGFYEPLFFLDRDISSEHEKSIYDFIKSADRINSKIRMIFTFPKRVIFFYLSHPFQLLRTIRRLSGK